MQDSKNISIFIASDDNYSPYVAVTMASICANTESFVDFYIIDDGIEVQNKEKIQNLKQKFDNFSIEFLTIDCKKEFSSIEYKNSAYHVSLTSYDRFLIPKLKPELKKAIYLDCDIVANKDIKLLYDIDLGSYAIAAVPESFAGGGLAEKEKERLGLNFWHEYFNTGVMLIDVQKWLEMDILSIVLKIEEEYRDKLKWADQDILNIIFDNNYKIISKDFNYMTQFKKTNENAVLRHFNTHYKPWNLSLDSKVITDIDLFWKYAHLTSFYQD